MRHWNQEELERFLEVRQEFFLDPTGSNKERFLDAAIMLQKGLFEWYLTPPAKFEGLVSMISSSAKQWSALRTEERRTMHLRRFALNSAAPELPAVEGSVSEHQWQKIRGSLGLGLSEPGSFDRFLAQLDDETNPSLRVNHRYLGELLPHDNMVSYLSSVTATFLNENAIIGKVSPCITHMEQAAVRWLLTLVGWDGGMVAEDGATHLPVQRLPTLAPPPQKYISWGREEPTGAVVAGGTIANISAMLIARNAVFDYLLAWPGATQWLGPMTAWKVISKTHHFTRLVVVTSKGAHYSVKKAALQAGVARGDVVELAGSENPWVLDGAAIEGYLDRYYPTGTASKPLLMAVVPIAGKTETGYVDHIEEIAKALDRRKDLLPTFEEVLTRVRRARYRAAIEEEIRALEDPTKAMDAFQTIATTWREGQDADSDLAKLAERLKGKNEFRNARHNRPFLHVDAAHGAAFVTLPALKTDFKGIELADTITVDGHKSFYCYYPCGGLLVRATRWAKAFSTEGAAYITEDELLGSDREHFVVFEGSRDILPSVGREVPASRRLPDLDTVYINQERRGLYEAVRKLVGRPGATDRSELTHNPFTEYLEGSRGPQGIMQLYFNLATLGLAGYRSLLGWTVLLRERLDEAVSLGMTDVRLVTDPSVSAVRREALRTVNPGSDVGPSEDGIRATDKRVAILTGGTLNPEDALGSASLEKEAGTLVPAAGGRFLRLSAGACNQSLMTYVPAREARLIATAPGDYWQKSRGRDEEPRILSTMKYLWRVNEQLWREHLYANPHFTYYVGHTTLELEVPWRLPVRRGPDGAPAAQTAVRPWEHLARLLTTWNAWTKQRSGECPFLQVLAQSVRGNGALDELEKALVKGRKQRTHTEVRRLIEACRAPQPRKVTKGGSADVAYGDLREALRRAFGPGLKGLHGGSEALLEDLVAPWPAYGRSFFCHKVIIMHPYTDESLLGDVLRRMAFWGERSVLDVTAADMASRLLFPDEGQSAHSARASAARGKGPRGRRP